MLNIKKYIPWNYSDHDNKLDDIPFVSTFEAAKEVPCPYHPLVERTHQLLQKHKEYEEKSYSDVEISEDGE